MSVEQAERKFLKITVFGSIGGTLLLCVFLMLMIMSCSDSKRASLSAYGSEGQIQCYSGGKLIYEGTSTGRIATVDRSDGWEFKDKKTNKFVRVTGDCLIIN